jgi:hypothetical protein
MRDPAREREQAAAAIQIAREAERQRLAAVALRILNSEDGVELLGYLSKKFHLRGRSFLSLDARSACCPYAAATRDGEKAVIWHLIELARLADPEFLIP